MSPSAVRGGLGSSEVASSPRRESWPAPAAPALTHRVVTSHEVGADGRFGRGAVEVAISTQAGALPNSQLVKIEVMP